MTARRRVVKRRTRATQSGTTQKSSLPLKPKVTIGPKSYGISNNDGRIVVRFWITQKVQALRKANSKKWFVIDQDVCSPAVAAGTSINGYSDKSEAVRVARRYRDEFGAYCKFPY